MIEPEDKGRSFPSRREFVAWGIGAFVVAATPAALRRRRVLVRRSVPVMGTIAEFALVHRDPRYAHRAIDAAIEELRRVDRTMTRFDPASEVGRANRGASAGPVPVSSDTAFVLREALRWAEASEGAFDPCLGRAVALWDVTRRREPPPGNLVRQLAGRRLYRALEVEARAAGPTVRFHDREVAIDLGGIAKGYGVDLAAEALRAYGIFDALIGVGGDLVALGRSEDGDDWKVGVRSPDDPNRLAGTLALSDRAVATSGDYLQFFRYRGRQYHHLLDPATGEPWRAERRSVTVVADRCLAADAAATAVFGLPPAEAERVLGACAPGARIAWVA